MPAKRGKAAPRREAALQAAAAVRPAPGTVARPDGPATMRDVSERAGVSISTVSHVLNNTRPVPETTRMRVVDAIKAVGYTPNSVARALKRAETRTLGIAIGDIANPHFTAIVDAIEQAARDQGYTVILASIGEDALRETDALNALLGRRIDGLILAPSADGGAAALEAAQRHHVAVVQIDRLASRACDAVVVGNNVGTRRLVAHLAALGHRRIGMLAGLAGLSSTAERIAGYRAALKAAGLGYDPTLVVSGAFNAEPARMATHALMSQDAPPTALFVANNLMTLGAMRALAERGRRVPDDVALVSFDDFAWADLFSPRLTVAAQPCREIGEAAVRLLLERLADPGLPPRLIRLPVEIRHRESCGCAAGAAPIR